MFQLAVAVYTLLSTTHKKSAFGIVLQLALSSLLDFFSIASFVPIILLIIHPGVSLSIPWLNKLYEPAGVNHSIYLAFVLTVLSLLFIFIKTKIQIWLNDLKTTFAYSVSSDLASRAVTRYFGISYAEFSSTDYSRESNRIANLPLIFANNIVIPLGTVISEILISLFLLSSLVIFNYAVFLFLSLLLIPVLITYRLRQKKIKQTSQELKATIPLLLKYTQQSVESLLEIRIHRKESFFKNRINDAFQRLENIFLVDNSNKAIILRTTELIVAVCVGLLLLYSLIKKQSYEDTVLLLALYGGACFRIVPSINRIFAALVQIRSNEYVVQELSGNISHHNNNFEDTDDALPFNDGIELRKISFSHPTGQLILNDTSLVIRRKEKILLTGKSGSGKTSLLLVLLRFVSEQSGEIVIDGARITPENTIKWRKLFGYVPQNPVILDASIIENIAFGILPEKINREKISKIITDLNLMKWIDELPEGFNTIIGEKGMRISGGQRQRIAIARSLYQGAEILLLDEITNQLDTATRQEIMRTLNDGALRDKTVIMVSHTVDEFSLFDSGYLLVNGQLNPLFQNQKSAL